jgi:glycosyltransferase involved in cell wall biosynthesis
MVALEGEGSLSHTSHHVPDPKEHLGFSESSVHAIPTASLYFSPAKSVNTASYDHTRSLTIIVPAFNEERTLPQIAERLVSVPHLLEVIIVDDCSTDNTLCVAESLQSSHPQIRVLKHSTNRGKTAALKTGFAAARGDIVVVQDADLEYDPSEIPDLVDPIITQCADVVYGSRFLVRRSARVLYFYHFLANKFLTFLSNLLTNINLTDVETGYKAFRREIIQQMIINSTGFGFEIEATAKIAKIGCVIYEVPISYHGRTYEEGKKIGLLDGIYACWLAIRYNVFCPRKKSFRNQGQLQRNLRASRRTQTSLHSQPVARAVQD